MLCVYVPGAPLVFLCRSTFRYHTLIMSCRPSGGNESLRLSIEHYLLATKHNTIEVLRKETFVIDLYICIVLAFKALHSPFWVKPMTPGKTGTFLMERRVSSFDLHGHGASFRRLRFSSECQASPIAHFRSSPIMQLAHLLSSSSSKDVFVLAHECSA